MPAVVIMGAPAGNVSFWSNHLLRADHNEHVEVHEISGLLAENLPDALREMEVLASVSRSRGNFMYQANINPHPDVHFSPDQWKEAVDTLEKNLGLEGHQRVVIEHIKNGRQHYHVVWNRVDADTLRVADMGGNYRTHEKTARELEQRFDLTPTPSPTKVNSPERKSAQELWEIRAAERSGIEPAKLKAEITDLWRSSDSGQAFAAALEDRGYVLAKGDRRDFCIIDQAGDAHSLARRLDGVNAKEVRAHMGDVDREALPSVAHGRETQRLTAAETRTLGKAAGEIRLAWSLSDSVDGLATTLEMNGMSLARVDASEAAASQRSQEFAKAVGNHAPLYREGEIVIVNSFGGVHRFNEMTTGETRTEMTKKLATIDHDTLLNVTDARDAMKEVARKEFYEQRQADRPWTKVEARIDTLQEQAVTPAAFAAALYREGITIARVDRAGIEDLATDQRSAFVADEEFHAPTLSEGELVAVNRFGGVHRLNPFKLDMESVEQALTTGARTIPTLGSVREEIAENRAADRDALEQGSADFWATYRERKDASIEARGEYLEEKTKRELARLDPPSLTEGAKKSALTVVDMATGVSTKLTDFVSALLGGSKAPPPDPATASQMGKIIAQRRALAAMENIRDSIDRGEGLKAEDIYNLTPTHLENIRHRGDDFVRSLIARMERYNPLQIDYGRTMER